MVRWVDLNIVGCNVLVINIYIFLFYLDEDFAALNIIDFSRSQLQWCRAIYSAIRYYSTKKTLIRCCFYSSFKLFSFFISYLPIFIFKWFRLHLTSFSFVLGKLSTHKSRNNFFQSKTVFILNCSSLQIGFCEFYWYC